MGYWDWGNWPWNSNRQGYERDKAGNHITFAIDGHPLFGDSDYLKLVKQNPVAATLIDIIASKLCQVRFEIEGVESDPLLDLLHNPNWYQSKQDFIKQWYWFMVSSGFMFIAPKGSVGFRRPEVVTALYNLKGSQIKFPDNFKTPHISTPEEISNFQQQQIIYKQAGREVPYVLSELIPFYDMANGLDGDFLLKSPSRIEGARKPISNIDIGYDAENVVLQTNGKELYSSTKKGDVMNHVGMSKDEKNEILAFANQKYGVSRGRSRAMIGNNLDWKSMHIALKDLGLAESRMENAQTLCNTFGVPSEIYELHTKGKTYENQEKAMVKMVQQTVQPIMDNFTNSFTAAFGYEGRPLRGSFDHLPEMQVIEEQRANRVFKLSQAIKNLVDAGFTPEAANQFLEQNGIESLNDGPE